MKGKGKGFGGKIRAEGNAPFLLWCLITKVERGIAKEQFTHKLLDGGMQHIPLLDVVRESKKFNFFCTHSFILDIKTSSRVGLNC